MTSQEVIQGISHNYRLGTLINTIPESSKQYTHLLGDTWQLAQEVGFGDDDGYDIRPKINTFFSGLNERFPELHEEASQDAAKRLAGYLSTLRKLQADKQAARDRGENVDYTQNVAYVIAKTEIGRIGNLFPEIFTEYTKKHDQIAKMARIINIMIDKRILDQSLVYPRDISTTHGHPLEIGVATALDISDETKKSLGSEGIKPINFIPKNDLRRRR
ncbi:MAG TPA: hypothetical protein VMR51_00390 [Patescibacteria group bacterium]|nr:hypothetical protein [Patescibacteria group bacterium]